MQVYRKRVKRPHVRVAKKLGIYIDAGYSPAIFALNYQIGFDTNVFAKIPKIRAPLVELVDARDSKSRSFGSAGSIPAGGTIYLSNKIQISKIN